MSSDHPPTAAPDRDRFVAKLAEQRAASRKSFAALARELDHPRSTLHGWCRGDHLPFPRDDEVFVRLLRSIGVDDPQPWLETLRALRQRSARVNPYLGLEPFTEADAARFRGRDALVERLIAAIDATAASGATTPLVVVGASGSGKTSLLRAGLVARLGERPGHAATVITPGPEPLHRIDGEIRRLSGARAATLVIDQFEEVFTLAADGAPEAVAEAVADAQRARIQVVIAVRADFFHHVAGVPYLLRALDRRQVVVAPMTTAELTEAIVAPARQVGLRVAPDLLTHLLREFDGYAHRSRRTHALPLLSHVLHRLVESTNGFVLLLSDYRATGGLADALELTADEALGELPGELRAVCRDVFLQLVELRTDTTPTRRRATWESLDRVADGADVRRVVDAFVRRRLLTVDHGDVTLSHEALITAWPTLRRWVDEQRQDLLVRRRVRGAFRTWHETGEPGDGLLRGTLLDEALRLVDGPLRSSLDDRERAFVEASRAEREAAAARDAALWSRQIAAQSDLLGARDPSLSGHLALEALAVAPTAAARSAVLRSCTSTAGPRFVGPPGPSAVATAPAVGRAVAAFHATGELQRFERRDGVVVRVDDAGPPLPHVHAVALDADGRRVAAATRDGVVVVIDGDEVQELPGVRFAGPAHAVVLSPDGTEAVAAGTSPGIVRWREGADGWHPTQVIERPTTTGLAIRWDDGLVAAAGEDGSVALVDAAGTEIWAADLRPAHPVASAVAVSPDGRALAAGYHDGSVRIWCLEDPRSPAEQPLGSAAFATWVNAVEFSPDGRLLAAASSDGSVRLWDTSTWREQRLELRHPSVVSGARFVGDRTLLTSSEDGIVRTWDVSRAITGSEASIWSLGFDRGGTALVAASRTMLTIDRGDGAERVRQEVAAPPELQMFSGTSAVASDGTSIVAGTRSGAVLVIDGTTGAPMRQLDGGLGPIVESVTLVEWGSPVERAVAAIDSSGRLHRWRLLPDGQVDPAGCVVCDGKPLEIVTVGDGLVAVTTEPGEVVVLDVSRDDEIVERSRFRTGESFPICAARRPGRPFLATGGADRAVSVWSIADWSEPTLLTRMVGPAGHVMTLDFDPVGDRLAAGTTDGRIWIWTCDEPCEPEHWATIETGEAGVYAVRFSPDGRHLVSAGPHHRITWWPLDVDAAAEAVRRRIGDPLTALERRRLLPSGVPGI